MGNGVTPKAISHRIAKIKDKANAYVKANPYAFDDLGSGKKGGKGGMKGVKVSGMKIGTGLKRKMVDMDDDDEGLVKKEVKVEQQDGGLISSEENTAGSDEGFMGFASASASEESKDKDILGSPGDLMNGIGKGDSMKRAQELLVGGATLTEEQRVWALREGGYLRSGNEIAAAAEEQEAQVQPISTAVQPKATEPLIMQLELEPETEPVQRKIGMGTNETSMVLVVDNAFVVDSSSGSSS